MPTVWSQQGEGFAIYHPGTSIKKHQQKQNQKKEKKTPILKQKVGHLKALILPFSPAKSQKAAVQWHFPSVYY